MWAGQPASPFSDDVASIQNSSYCLTLDNSRMILTFRKKSVYHDPGRGVTNDLDDATEENYDGVSFSHYLPSRLGL